MAMDWLAGGALAAAAQSISEMTYAGMQTIAALKTSGDPSNAAVSLRCLRFNNPVDGETHLSSHACHDVSGGKTESVPLAVFPGKGHLGNHGLKRADDWDTQRASAIACGADLFNTPLELTDGTMSRDWMANGPGSVRVSANDTDRTGVFLVSVLADSCEAQQASAIACGAALLQLGQHCSTPLLPSKKALCEEPGSISQYSSRGLAAVRSEEDASRWCTLLPDIGDCQCMFCARQCQLATGRPSPISSSASTGWWWCELTLSTCMSATARSKIRPRCLTVAAGPAFDMLRAVQEDCPYGTVNEVAGSPLPENRANVSLRGGMLDSARGLAAVQPFDDASRWCEAFLATWWICGAQGQLGNDRLVGAGTTAFAGYDCARWQLTHERQLLCGGEASRATGVLQSFVLWGPRTGPLKGADFGALAAALSAGCRTRLRGVRIWWHLQGDRVSCQAVGLHHHTVLPPPTKDPTSPQLASLELTASRWALSGAPTHCARRLYLAAAGVVRGWCRQAHRQLARILLRVGMCTLDLVNSDSCYPMRNSYKTFRDVSFLRTNRIRQAMGVNRDRPSINLTAAAELRLPPPH